MGFRIQVAGLENVPRRGGGIVASNHVSVLDPVFVALAATQRGRSVHYLTVADVFDKPVRGWALRQIGQIPLRRGIGDWAAIDEVAAIIRGGALGGISPEGRVGDGFSVQPLQKGAARIALAANAPVIPVGVWGTQHRWGERGVRLDGPLRPSVAVVFGVPLPAAGDPHVRADVRTLTDRLAAALGDLVDRAKAMAGGLGVSGGGPGTHNGTAW